MGKAKEMAYSGTLKLIITMVDTFTPGRSELNFARSYFQCMGEVK
jgi:hypothetical protein